MDASPKPDQKAVADASTEIQEWLDMPPVGSEFGAPRPRDPGKPRYFIDTEFTSFEACQLISIAIVGEDGSEFYGEVTDFDSALCSDFVREAVLPQLGNPPGHAMPFHQLRREMLSWLSRIPVKPRPVQCFDFDGDLKLLEHLIGGPLPKPWKTENIWKQRDDLEVERFFMNTGLSDHHALHDARANAFAFIEKP